MSGVARIHQQSGWIVTGSDEGFYPPVSDLIEQYGIPCQTPYAASNIPDGVSRIVIGRHAKLSPEDCLEVAEAYRLQASSGVEILSFPEALESFVKDTHNIVVAGSFGKSSCAAMCTHVLQAMGKFPGWFIGADSVNLRENGHTDNSELFVIEGDEYPAKLNDLTPKFAFYHPRVLLLTSCEHDHINVYPTLNDYLIPFRKLLADLPSDGTLVCCSNGAHIERVIHQTRLMPIWYGIQKDQRTEWWVENITYSARGSHFEVFHRGTKVTDAELQVLGDHMIENALAVIATLVESKIADVHSIAHALYTFRGVRRRLERISKLDSTPIYNDFGSSQAKLLAGIEAIKKMFPDRRITVVFEPHTFSFRNRAALPQYETLFKACHRVIVLPPPTHGSGSHDQSSYEEIMDALNDNSIVKLAIDNWPDLRTELAVWSERHSDVILFEGSGDFYGLWPQIEAWAKNK